MTNHTEPGSIVPLSFHEEPDHVMYVDVVNPTQALGFIRAASLGPEVESLPGNPLVVFAMEQDAACGLNREQVVALRDALTAVLE